MSKKKKNLKSAAAGLAVAGAAATGAILTSKQEQNDESSIPLKGSTFAADTPTVDESVKADTEQVFKPENVKASAPASSISNTESDSIKDVTTTPENDELITEVTLSFKERLSQFNQSIQNI